ncbi:MAG: glycine oxidase ThiO [Actinomycetota bacterium]
MSTAPDAIVVGGGAIGLSIAWRTARMGASVTVIDPNRADAASSVAAGMLAPVTEVHYGEEPLLQLNLRSAKMYPRWIAELEQEAGTEAGYNPCGTISVARDADDRAALDHLLEFQRSLGLEVERLSATQVKDLEPACTSRGGVLVQADHQIDPIRLTEALRKACDAVGVRRIEAVVEEVTIDDGAVTNVVLDDGESVGTSTVVVAAGAAASEIKGLPDGLFPVRPVKGQIVELSPGPEPCPITRNVRGLDVYLVPRPDGRLLIGATMEERGWDPSPTAGAVHDLLRYAYELVPGITEMTFTGVRVGFRPGTPDNAPILGATPIAGLIAATGHFRNGILLAPVTADAIADLIVRDELWPAIEAFSADRFGSR